MNKTLRAALCQGGILLLLVAVCALAFAFVPHAQLAQTVLLSAFCVLVFFTAVLFVEWKRSVKKTLYLYKNIVLVGLILFLFMFSAVTLGAFLTNILQDSVELSGVYETLLSFPRLFSWYAIVVIFVLCLLAFISNVSLVRHEGLHPRNVWSVVIAALYLGGTAVVYFLCDSLEAYVVAQGARADSRVWVFLNTALVLFLLTMLCYFECVLLGTALMGWKAARQVPTYDRDYIIILGCCIDKKGGLLPLLRGRVNRAIRFAWEQEVATGKPVKYVPSGGQGSNEIMSEGSAMELYLLTRGAESDEVFPEKKSINTLENMQFSKAIIDRLKPDAKCAFATTNYHMLRSGILAHRVGLDAEGIAGDTKWYFWPNGFLREFIGILAMNVKAHVIVGVALAVLSVAVGFIGCYLL